MCEEELPSSCGADGVVLFSALRPSCLHTIDRFCRKVHKKSAAPSTSASSLPERPGLTSNSPSPGTSPKEVNLFFCYFVPLRSTGGSRRKPPRPLPSSGLGGRAKASGERTLVPLELRHDSSIKRPACLRAFIVDSSPASAFTSFHRSSSAELHPHPPPSPF